MIIKKHQIYIDAKSVKKIGPPPVLTRENEEFKKLKEAIEAEAKENARLILEEAQRRADEIVKRADEEAKRIIEEAKKAYVKEIEALKEERERLRVVINSIPSKLDAEIEKLTKLVLPVLKVIYRKILEKDIDEELAYRRIKNVLSAIFQTSNIIIKLSPQDLQRVKSSGLQIPEGVILKAEPSLNEGDVIVESDLGIIDKTTDFRWKMIEDIIDEIL